jgi:protein O-mannosyl-transferase
MLPLTTMFQKHPRRIIAGIITILSFLLYGNTLTNQFCQDDEGVITKNKFTLNGVAGIPDIFTTNSFAGYSGNANAIVTGARYRPLSIATFAVEHDLFHSNPMVSHLINILLYALTVFLLYLVFRTVLKQYTLHYQPIAIWMSLLFLFHPIHTEVVANIKGRDEILALLLSLAGLCFILKYCDKQKLWLLICGVTLWFLALFSKENAIVFWVLIPPLVYHDGLKSIRQKPLPIILLSIAALVFLAIRFAITVPLKSIPVDLMNNPFIDADVEQKYATIFLTLGKYIGLLIFPNTLTTDYYPYHIPLVDWSNAGAIIGLVLNAGLIVLGFVCFKKNKLLFIAIVFYLLPLLPVSNILFPVGTFMSERFVYFSSIGFCLVIAYVFQQLLVNPKISKALLITVFTCILLLYATKTIGRNRDWYNDYTLFTADVKTSGNSAKINFATGGILLESTDTIADPLKRSKTLQQSIYYLRRSVTIHPKYYTAWLLLGNAYLQKEHSKDSALWCYTTILNAEPDCIPALKNAQSVAMMVKDVDLKVGILKNLLQYNPKDYTGNYLLGNIYGKEKNELDKAIQYLNVAITINPSGVEAFTDLGIIHAMQSDFKASIYNFRKALSLDQNNPSINQYLGMAYQNIGDNDNAAIFYQRAETLKRRITGR